MFTNFALSNATTKKPFRFYLKWDEEQFPSEPLDIVSNLQQKIQGIGGCIVYTFLDMLNDNVCIPLLITRNKPSKSVVKNFSIFNQRDLFDARFILDSIRSNGVKDLNNYRLPGYCCNEYDANEVLNQEKGWDNVFVPVEALGHGPNCSGVLKFNAFYHHVKALGNDWFNVDIELLGKNYMKCGNSDLIWIPKKYKNKTVNQASFADPAAIGDYRPKNKRPMFKYIRRDILQSVYAVAKELCVPRLGNSSILWEQVCRKISSGRANQGKPDLEFGIRFSTIEEHWVGIQKHFYSYLLKNAQFYFVHGSDELRFFKKWSKQ